MNGRPSDGPEPLAHATQPDDSPVDRSDEAGRRVIDSGEAELADAQLALGRPELAASPADQQADDAELAREAEAAAGPLAPAAPPAKVGPGTRLVNFAQGSWRELQRVQWPDRRQVMQATGVVLGFVIVAGLFLGAADFVAQKLVNFILK